MFMKVITFVVDAVAVLIVIVAVVALALGWWVRQTYGKDE